MSSDCICSDFGHSAAVWH